MRFHNYKDIFCNLIKQSSVITSHPIITMIITYDSTRAVTVSKKDDQEAVINMYDLETNEQTFEEQIGGDNDDQYIKVKEVE